MIHSLWSQTDKYAPFSYATSIGGDAMPFQYNAQCVLPITRGQIKSKANTPLILAGKEDSPGMSPS